MSTISKVAVYDARLIQEEPAYAVTKGALSVSVAPFSAIAANASQMTFQVLVPSLNVFVDRKIQLSTALTFSAQLYYSGPRSASTSVFGPPPANFGLSTCTIIGNLLTAPNGAGYPIGTMIYSVVSGTAAAGGALVAPGTALQALVQPAVLGLGTALIVGTSTSTLGTQAVYTSAAVTGLPTIFPGTMIVASLGTVGANSLYLVNYAQEFFATNMVALAAGGNAGTAGIQPAPYAFSYPLNYDVPDPSMSIDQSPTQDVGFMNLTDSEFYQQRGYVTAVGPKDLSWCAFPVQSCLANMTATMNDCTVTTNGDTLKEQLMLTSLRDNNRQRTTPCKLDTYAWGRDDCQNESGNFSSYSITNNSNGETPNGAFPTTWYADAGFTRPLSSVAGTATGQGATGVYPFNIEGAAFSFNLEGATVSNNVASSYAGVGWYVAKTNTTGISNVQPGLTIVPFVNNRPVWTCGFPGGDLVQSGATYISPASTTNQGGFLAGGFQYVGASNQLTLLQNVPPMCMVGARLYSINGAISGAVGGTPPTTLGVVTSILSGALGQLGSVYLVTTPGGANIQTTAPTGLCLSAGWQVSLGPMPVFGQVSVVEPLVISPLVWADSAEFQVVGLYGMTNMQFVLNFAAISSTFAVQNSGVGISDPRLRTAPYWTDDLTKVNTYLGNPLRSSGVRTTISNLAYGAPSISQYGPWTTPTMYVNFLTPGPDVTLPLVSSVPYVEFPRYALSRTGVSLVGTQTVPTNTISLTSIPDMVMLYVKPGTRGPTQLDTYIPISGCQITFDNFSNLCSSFQQFSLYESAIAAGMEMDWHQWRGYTQAAYPSLALVSTPGAGTLKFKQTGVTQLSGGPLILRMGIDITLSPGLAPGCLGNYSFQANVNTSNPYGFFDYLTSYTITLIAINTGFFETVRGQSAIRKTILNSADVEASSPETGMTKTDLHRMVGRGGHGFISGSTGMGKAMRMARMHGRHGSRPTNMGGLLGGPGGKRMRDGGGGSGIV
jgi:hypothetical protein